MLFVMLALTLLATAIAYQRGVSREGLAQSYTLLLQVAPILVLAFLLAGMVSVLIPTQTLTRLLGTESGMRGLLIGTVAGALTPGGPFLAFPMLAVLLKGGASVGAVTAYLSAWALLGVHRMLAFEIPILGFRFVAVRAVASLAAPVLIGWLAQLIWLRAALRP
jgi:uncharacterized membrane protein YraQ (UPF0718 family)